MSDSCRDWWNHGMKIAQHPDPARRHELIQFRRKGGGAFGINRGMRDVQFRETLGDAFFFRHRTLDWPLFRRRIRCGPCAQAPPPRPIHGSKTHLGGSGGLPVRAV